jgi:RimJ/RimL family protein N-acetyltransferase
VRLRPFEEADVARVVEGCRDELTQRFTRVPSPYGEEDARAFVAGAHGRRVRGESLDLAVTSAATGLLIGAVGFNIDRHDPQRAEIGYWVSPDARGAGVATRALTLLSRWALREGGLVRIDLLAGVTNMASLRVAERSGFVREGTLRRAWYRGPEREDMALFSLLAEDLGAEARTPSREREP